MKREHEAGIDTRYNSRVIEQVPGRVLAHYIAVAWTTAGPLGGVLIGAYLSRAWDHKKWMNDNRKEEFRELIDALTEAATAVIVQPMEANNQVLRAEGNALAMEKNTQALRAMKTRIYIANDVKEMNWFDRWGESMKFMRETGKIYYFEDTFEIIRDEIIERATTAP